MGFVIKVFISLFFFPAGCLFSLSLIISIFPIFFLLHLCSLYAQHFFFFLFFLPRAWLTDGRNCNLAIWQWLEGYTKHRCCTYCTETRHNLLFNTNYSPRSKKKKEKCSELPSCHNIFLNSQFISHATIHYTWINVSLFFFQLYNIT